MLNKLYKRVGDGYGDIPVYKIIYICEKTYCTVYYTINVAYPKIVMPLTREFIKMYFVEFNDIWHTLETELEQVKEINAK